MKNIKIGRYADPQAIGYTGWIEPEDRTWTLFIGLDGAAELYSTTVEPAEPVAGDA